MRVGKTKELQIKHAAFDWGLTISPDLRSETFPQFADYLVEEVLEPRGIKRSPEEVAKLYFEIDGKTKKSWGIGVTHFNQEEFMIAELLESLDMPYDAIYIEAPALLNYYRRIASDYYKSLKYNKEVADTLDHLRSHGIYTSIFSNERRHTLRGALAYSDLLDKFDYITTSHEYEMQKPSIEAMEKFLEETGFKPEETAYIGDDPVRDVEWAKSVGAYAILFTPPDWFYPEQKSTSWRDTKGKVEPDLVIKNFSDLKNVIKKAI